MSSLHPLVLQPYGPVVCLLSFDRNVALFQSESGQKGAGQGGSQRVSVALHVPQGDSLQALQRPHVPGTCSHGGYVVSDLLDIWFQQLGVLQAAGAPLPIACS